MIISDLYKTEISANKYNVGLGATDVTLTVTLKDFNNANITAKTVTVNCDKGYFTSNNGTSNGINGTSTKSISLDITNGTGTLTWTASETGLCTFSVNDAKIQILVGNETKTILDANGITFKVNELTRTAILRIYIQDKNFANTNQYYLTTNGNITQNSKPVIIAEKYRPVTPTVVIQTFGRGGATGLIYRDTNATDTAGTIALISGTSTGVQNFHGYATWMF